jgi:hypothetical protein
MRLIGIARDHGTLRTDNVRRAVATAPYWLCLVEFNDLPVIDICAKRPLCRLNVGRERITRKLYPVRRQGSSRISSSISLAQPSPISTSKRQIVSR